MSQSDRPPGTGETVAAANQDVATGETVAAAEQLAHSETLTGPETASDNRNAIVLPAIDADRYVDQREFARGGLGRITRVHDIVLKRPVLLKQLLRDNPDAERRFVREALITARLAHPGIVPIYEAGRLPGGEAFYSMKPIEGDTLSARLAQAHGLRQRLELLPQIITVAETMGYAHSERVIHRDLKPANIIVGAFGETVVIDWGLAKDLRADAADSQSLGPASALSPDLTAEGSVMGTPVYMSPRQAEGQDIDERADVYAIGAILYETLAGQRPYYEHKTAADVLAALEDGPPQPITTLEPNAPPELVAIAEKAMAHDRGNRYPTAAELADELRRFQTGKLVAAHEYSAWQLVRRWLARHRAAVAVAGVMLVVLAATATITVSRIVRERDRANAESARAKRANAASRARLGELHLEQGRQAMFEHRHSEAARHLRQAQSLGQDSSVLRMLLARAEANVGRLTRGYSLTGHTQHIGVIAFSPAGNVLVSGGGDGLRIWDWRGQRQLARITLASVPASIDFAPGGKHVAVQTLAGRIYVVDTAGWRLSATIENGGVSKRLAFSPDGGLLATGSAEHGARVWNVVTGALVRSVTNTNGLAVAFSHDGKQLFTGTRTGAVLTTWDTASWKQLGDPIELSGRAIVGLHVVRPNQLAVHTDKALVHWDYGQHKKLGKLGTPSGVLLSGADLPMGRKFGLLWYSGGEAQLYDMGRRQPLIRFRGHNAQLFSAGLSPDQRHAFTAGTDGRVLVWSRDAGRPVVVLAERGGSTTGVEFAADSRHLAFTTGWNQIKVIDFTRSPRLKPGALVTLRASGVAMTGDGKSVLVSAAYPPVSIIALSTRKTDSKLTAGLRNARVVAARRGARFVTANPRGDIATFDAESKTRLANWKGGGDAVAISADGSVVAGVTSDGQLGFWDATTGQLRSTHRVGVKPWALRFSADDALLLIAGAGGNGAVLRRAEATVVRLPAHAGKNRGGRFSPDGTWVATLGTDGVVRVSSTTDGKQRFELAGVSALAVNRNGVLATGMRDGRIVLRDPQTGESHVAWKAHPQQILALRFAPDGRRLVSSALRDDVFMWDAQTGRKLMTFGAAPTADFTHVAISPDGNTLVTANRVEVFPLLWDISTAPANASPQPKAPVVQKGL